MCRNNHNMKQVKNGLILITITTMVVAIYLYIHNCIVGKSFSLQNAPDIESIMHLALPIAVLAMEFFMLRRMSIEEHERKETVDEFRSLAINGRRVQYLMEIAKGISEAKSEVFFTSASMETSSSSPAQKTILEAVKTREKAGSPYSHKGLIAKRTEALPGAMELFLFTHIELRFCQAVAISRLKFFVKDRESCVLGISDGHAGLHDPKKTTMSVSVQSVMLGDALRVKFDSLWEKGSTLGSYIDELILGLSPTPRPEVILGWFESIEIDKQKLIDKLTSISSEFEKIQQKSSTP